MVAVKEVKFLLLLLSLLLLSSSLLLLLFLLLLLLLLLNLRLLLNHALSSKCQNFVRKSAFVLMGAREERI